MSDNDITDQSASDNENAQNAASTPQTSLTDSDLGNNEPTSSETAEPSETKETTQSDEAEPQQPEAPAEQTPNPTSSEPEMQEQQDPAPAENPTPEPPMAQQSTQPAEQASEEDQSEKKHSPSLLPIISAIVIFALIGGFLFINMSWIKPTTTTSSIPTTIPQPSVSNIEGCTVVSKPGIYFLANGINTSITQGACIKVISSNVRLVGNNNKLGGNGPYTHIAPFTYGIELSGVSNVTVTGFNISSFSYGIHLNNTARSAILNNNITSSTLSNIYVQNSTNNTVRNNLISYSESMQGGIYLQSGRNNSIINNTIKNNVYYGLVINTTGNSFTKDMFFNNPVDLVCNITSTFKYTNTFSGSTCSLNDFCEFAHCTSNVPFNLTSVNLYPGAVKSCGQIALPGHYTLSADLTTSNYLNTSNKISKQAACITIISPNVYLDCAGHSITNSGSAVYVIDAFNVSVANCTFANNTYGLRAKSAFGLNASEVSSSGSGYGIYLQNSTSGKFSSVDLKNNTYGLYLDLTDGIIFSSLVAKGNKYGIYAQSGGSDVFNGGSVENNTKVDAYCSAATYDSHSDLWQNIACGVTDCNWATSCTLHVPPMLSSYPIDSCRQISYPGNYLLTNNLLAPESCMSITASNVLFNCDGYSVLGSNTGTAFKVSGASNVSIENCKIYQFAAGVNVSGSDHVNASALTISGVRRGVVLNNVESSSVTNVKVLSSSVSGFNFTRLMNSTITNDYTDNGTSKADGFVFSNSSNNWIYSNFAGTNPGYGFKFVDSLNNVVLNNSAFSNTQYDYYCSPSSGSVYSEPININFGVTKENCRWLIETPKVSQSEPCEAIISGTQITLTNDMYYAFGATCFSIFNTKTSSANNTQINCNGHTIFASRGGTFINIVNSSSITIKNCILKDFTTAISSEGKKTSIINNTIDGSNSSIMLNGADSSTVESNRIENSTHGLIVSNTNFATVQDNSFNNFNTAMMFSGGSSVDIENNSASGGLTGMYLAGTTMSLLHGNLLLNSSSSGLICSGAASSKSSSNRDLGGEVCSSNKACLWIASSQCQVSS